MIIVMSTTASEGEVQHVLDRLHQDGLDGQVSQGAERTVIGVIGTGFAPDYQEHFEAMPG
ncbi:MAG: 3-deoxy-7-phosphoheptulonate synthase, partial [Chloroflexi bacterium]|nr:3-deoxy-7-phosphoheptulonate synthase [Chloroflexota bacterium]